MSGTAVRAVLFDFGGVLTTSPFDAFARYEAEHALPAGFIRSVNARNHHHNAWARLGRAELSPAAFDAAFAAESAELGHEVPGADVLALLAGDLRPAMVRALTRVHERLATGLLTNNFLTGDGATPSPFAAVLAEFDVIVESARVGVRKPEPRFYELACDALAIEPSEAVFLDDLGVNLKPAAAMGMRTIKVVDPDAAITELASIVGFSLA